VEAEGMEIGVDAVVVLVAQKMNRSRKYWMK